VVLFGIGELRVRLGGVSRQRVDQLTRRDDFPCPCAELAQGRVWLGEDIESWIKEYKRAEPGWPSAR
jgi:predicted DNA-binding transcriptional regulator AlpA